MKKISTALLATALAAPMFLGATVVKAEDQVASVPSEATIMMKKKGGDTPLPNEGPLTIDHISDIVFGEQYISGSTQDYSARYTAVAGKVDDEFTATNITVQDDRGTNKGWTLQAEISEFVNTAVGKENDKLDASFISLKSGKVVDFENGTDLEATIAAPAVGESGLKLDTDPSIGGVTIATAAEGKGMGQTNIFFGENSITETPINDPESRAGNDNVTLTIPGSTTKTPDASYKAEITWTIIEDAS